MPGVHYDHFIPILIGSRLWFNFIGQLMSVVPVEIKRNIISTKTHVSFFGGRMLGPSRPERHFDYFYYFAFVLSYD
jgi:hypothetical protein